jgi:hypothetical protein
MSRAFRLLPLQKQRHFRVLNPQGMTPIGR